MLHHGIPLLSSWKMEHVHTHAHTRLLRRTWPHCAICICMETRQGVEAVIEKHLRRCSQVIVSGCFEEPVEPVWTEFPLNKSYGPCFTPLHIRQNHFGLFVIKGASISHQRQFGSLFCFISSVGKAVRRLHVVIHNSPRQRAQTCSSSSPPRGDTVHLGMNVLNRSFCFF